MSNLAASVKFMSNKDPWAIYHPSGPTVISLVVAVKAIENEEVPPLPSGTDAPYNFIAVT